MAWTDKFFNSNYLKLHLPILTEDLNEKDVNFIEGLLKLPPGSAILDLPCGFGRHSILLAKKGYRVTGIDYQPDFIDLARKNAGELPNLKFLVEDMRKINFYQEFDAIINMFTSFGYFSDEENFEVLKKFSRALKKGGKLVIDMVNREWAINSTRENGLVWLLYPDNKVFLANNKYNLITGRWFSDQVIVENGKSFEQHQDIRLYAFTELKAMMNETGLAVTDVYGDEEFNDYTGNTKNMIVVAKKQ